jgi:hypothetical protein
MAQATAAQTKINTKVTQPATAAGPGASRDRERRAAPRKAPA